MEKKIVFKSSQPNTDFNRPSAVFAYANQLVERELAATISAIREVQHGTHEKKKPSRSPRVKTP
jgi:hypothetical protein